MAERLQTLRSQQHVAQATTGENGKGQGRGIYDVLGVGIGPFNLGLAALLSGAEELQGVFFEQKPQFDWHPGMLLDGTTLQVPFFADLVTMADPTHPLSFLNYLHVHGRLYHFYFLERFQIPRREYNHYCQWAAAQLTSCRFGSRVEAIALETFEGRPVFAAQVRDLATDTCQTYTARDLVIGVGSKPQAARRFQGLPSGDVFHSADFADRLERCRKARSITVVGSGQSAAEVFYQLLGEQAEHGYRLDWFTRSPGFFPMEYSKLGLEHFSPDYTNYFFRLPQVQKDVTRSRQALLYKGISAKTIADIYDTLYELSVGGHRPNVRMLALTEVDAIEATDAAGAGTYRLSCRHIEEDQPFEHESDVVILATGYGHELPGCIEPLRELLQWDEQGRSVVESDYRLSFREELPGGNRIYVQNAELHTHGVGAPDLGLGAYRNSVILNSMCGRTVYDVRDRNVFQQFGVRD